MRPGSTVCWAAESACPHGLPIARLINTRHGMGAAQPRSRGEWLYRRTMRRTDIVAAVCEAARQRFAQQGVRPRERLLAHGPEALSDAELLAIYLRVGVRGKSAVDLARDLLHRFDGRLSALAEASLEELASVSGIGMAKAAQL